MKAHSFFLMTASPIFHQIFTSDCVSDNSRPDLRIAGISKQTMTEICRYAYTENVNLTRGNMLLILYAATKFQMKFLVEKTINFIVKDGMAETTVFKILEANKVDKNMVINMKCFDFIEKNHQKCFKQKDFLSLPIDTLHLMMQTCKLPQTAGKAAIALWSAQAANSDEDLDDLLALIDLNDYQEETNNGGGSGSDHQTTTDSESVNSKNSRANRPRNRGGQNQMNQQQGNPTNFNNRQYGNPQNFNNQQQYPKQEYVNQQRNPNQQQRGRGGMNGNAQRGRGSHVQGTHNSQNNFNQHEQQLAGVNGLIFLGTQQGLLTRKNFKFANLDLSTFSKSIAISEIRFVYDLSATDKEFELWIDDMTDEKALLFYEKVSTHGKTEGGYTRYVLPRPCEISAGRKIRLRIEFKNQEHRLSFEDFAISSSSAKDRLGVRREPNINSYAYIVSAIAFHDC